MKLYIDSSALVKLVQREPESTALRRYLRRERGATHVTSLLARVEVIRAVAGGGGAAIAHARRLLARMHQVALDRELLDQAAAIGVGDRLRSLDAIHLASAQAIGADLHAIVTYDERMATAARTVGMPVDAPA